MNNNMQGCDSSLFKKKEEIIEINKDNENEVIVNQNKNCDDDNNIDNNNNNNNNVSQKENCVDEVVKEENKITSKNISSSRKIKKTKKNISCRNSNNDNDKILKMHEYVAGSKDRVEELLLAKLKDIIMEKASNITSSQAVEDRESLANEIRKEYVNNPELLANGIKVEQFSITQISFDNTTTALFEAQQKADLQKKTAEAEKQNLIMQKERTEAEYAQKIAASKGAAEVEMMKQVTDAERQKKLAEIEAQKKVAIEQLAKQEALVKASKLLELAEVEKKTEAEKLEVIKLQASQKVESAKAKQQEIQLSGAITETERYKLEVERDTKIGIAKHVAEGISKMTLPKTVIVGGSSGEKLNSMETFFNLMNVKQAETLAQ
jgi:hypothetical protein